MTDTSAGAGEVSTDVLRRSFREGFYSRRPAATELIIDEPGQVESHIASRLPALDAGELAFAYPGHDRAPFDVREGPPASRGGLAVRRN
jgi:hypothetical protein